MFRAFCCASGAAFEILGVARLMRDAARPEPPRLSQADAADGPAIDDVKRSAAAVTFVSAAQAAACALTADDFTPLQLPRKCRRRADLTPAATNGRWRCPPHVDALKKEARDFRRFC